MYPRLPLVIKHLVEKKLVVACSRFLKLSYIITGMITRSSVKVSNQTNINLDLLCVAVICRCHLSSRFSKNHSIPQKIPNFLELEEQGHGTNMGYHVHVS